jgi:hypothetical protein
MYSLPVQSSDTDNGEVNNDLVQDIVQGRSKNLSQTINTKKMYNATILHEFMVMLSVCHTVIPEKIDSNIIYHAASPGKKN